MRWIKSFCYLSLFCIFSSSTKQKETFAHNIRFYLFPLFPVLLPIVTSSNAGARVLALRLNCCFHDFILLLSQVAHIIFTHPLSLNFLHFSPSSFSIASFYLLFLSPLPSSSSSHTHTHIYTHIRTDIILLFFALPRYRTLNHVDLYWSMRIYAAVDQIDDSVILFYRDPR
jgi:hypothetical protein